MKITVAIALALALSLARTEDSAANAVDDVQAGVNRDFVEKLEESSAKIAMSKEDHAYWSRLLEDTDMSVAPPPTSTPPDEECQISVRKKKPRFCADDCSITTCPYNFCLSPLQVEITCADTQGTECNLVQSPAFLCPADLTTVRFKYTGESCADSINGQVGDTCEDFEGGPPLDTEVLVTCKDGETILSSEALRSGGDITVMSDALPTILSCTVTSLDETTTYQEVSMNVQSSFFLKDRYGSLEVDRCDDQDCIVLVVYTYTVTNVGSLPLEITSMLRERDGQTSDLTDQVDPTDVDAGGDTAVKEADTVDYCLASVITTDVQVFSQGEECVQLPVRRGLLRHLDSGYRTMMASGKFELWIN